ncbi:fibronectin type III domain-containing protein [Bacillus sonorensis]|uniref:fibronectin type III domain-containing protein n=1 Tax=Bacillus sonorensis TaxID=119858 RepID=UPI00098B80A4|nr:fibronectin type III domain-containing protein [Bacillus sonorensis]
MQTQKVNGHSRFISTVNRLTRLHPKAPQNLSYTATVDSVTVDWEPVDGAESYNIYTGPEQTLAGNVTSPPHTISGLTADTELIVYVSTVNAAGESAKSEIVTRTTAS